MAPRIARGGRRGADAGGGAGRSGGYSRRAEGRPVEAQNGGKAAEMLRAREARRLVEANCDYVGERFAEEARRIHYGEIDEKHGIYGELTEEEARALAEEGIEFGRIPWVPVADQ